MTMTKQQTRLGLVLTFLAILNVLYAFPNSSPIINADWGVSDRLMHLYTASDWNSFHLQINHDGSVDGTPTQTIYSAIMIKSESAGHVVITGVKTNRYLCMDRSGNVFGYHDFNHDDCVFKHETLENNFDIYHSPKHNYVISLKEPKHRFRPGMDLPPYSQFLSLKNEIPITRFNAPEPEMRIPEGNFADPSDIIKNSRNWDFSPSIHNPYQDVWFPFPSGSLPIIRAPLPIIHNNVINADDPEEIVKMKTYRYFKR
ncbi:fibroblast growth factor 23 [Xenopus laevis]|uniref:FGF n=2 Tax=Xenopus laevis TaxID=8355 RepID=A0A974D6Q3_XENLA|nr:fibroblast growth factor 23 [Xenopus laevis]OCT86242.1 hypothetical protein XELAEV_18019934mg [Xenopus laevis]